MSTFGEGQSRSDHGVHSVWALLLMTVRVAAGINHGPSAHPSASLLSKTKTCLDSRLIYGVQHHFGPARLFYMGPQHRQSLVGPTQHVRIFYGLHTLLELVHVVLVIPQDIL